MSANQKCVTTMGVTPETLEIYRQLSERTGIPLIQIMDELSKQIKVILDRNESSDRLIYMATALPKQNVVALTFGLMFVGSCSDADILKTIEEKGEN